MGRNGENGLEFFGKEKVRRKFLSILLLMTFDSLLFGKVKKSGNIKNSNKKHFLGSNFGGLKPIKITKNKKIL
jgi:hypothetical protein